MLDYIHLQWYRSVGEAGQLSSVQLCASVPVGSTGEFVHWAKANFGITFVNEKENEGLKKRKYTKICNKKCSWHIIYLNRFHRCIEEDYHFENEG